MRHRTGTVVVGRGMMGSAAAAHLCELSRAAVTLIGPSEPPHARAAAAAPHGTVSADLVSGADSDRRGAGEAAAPKIFGAHYDEGRIARVSDRSPVWAALAGASHARYRQVEASSGVRFYHEVGHVAIGLSDHEYIQSVQKTTAAAGVEHTVLPSADLPSRFPWLRLPQSEGGSDAAFTAVLEPKAGWISARGHVEAHCTLVTQRKGAVVDDAVVAVRRLRDKTPDGCLFEVDTASGDVFACEKVIVAAGGFVNARPLIPAELGEHDGDQAYQQLELQLLTAQTTRLRVTDAVGETLKEMPSLIVKCADFWAYVLPPIAYPDGHTYVKLGGASNHHATAATTARNNGEVPALPGKAILRTDAEVAEWYQSGGDPDLTALHLRIITELIPCLATVAADPASVVVDTCVTSHTPTKRPYIGEASPGVVVVGGGNGLAAKSADEIGRLAAVCATGESRSVTVAGQECSPVMK